MPFKFTVHAQDVMMFAYKAQQVMFWAVVIDDELNYYSQRRDAHLLLLPVHTIGMI